MKNIFQMSLAFLVVFGILQTSLAQDSAAPTPAPMPPPVATPETEPYKALTWNELVQRKYNLSNEQMKSMTDAKLVEPDMARVAEMSKLSGKSIDEILKMRSEQKSGWGKIAKDLGLDANVVGKSVSALRKERNDERKKEHDSKKAAEKAKRELAKKERELKREEARKEREEKKEAKRAERAEKKENRGQGKKDK